MSRAVGSVNAITKERLRELEEIQEENGLLRAADVVAYAKDSSTALHSWPGWKNWDEEVAAENYWLSQATVLIRAMVTVKMIDNKNQRLRAFVSIIGDRTHGGGYRPSVEVLSDNDMRSRLLQTALQELAAFQKRYRDIQQLAGVFAEIEKVLRRKPRRRHRTVPTHTGVHAST